MKQHALLTFIVLFLFAISYSCKTSYPTKFLHLNEKIIIKKTKWVVWLENEADFLIKGKNLSKDTLKINHDGVSAIVSPQSSFEVNVGQSNRAELVNTSDRDIAISIKINYSRTNLIQKTYENKD